MMICTAYLPSPSIEVVRRLDVGDRVREKVTHNVRTYVCDGDQSKPPLQVLSWIVERANEDASGNESCIKNTNEESRDYDLIVVLHEALRNRNDTFDVVRNGNKGGNETLTDQGASPKDTCTTCMRS